MVGVEEQEEEGEGGRVPDVKSSTKELYTIGYLCLRPRQRRRGKGG